MRELKIRTPHYWIELPYDLPVIDLARLLAKTRLRLRWNNRIQDCTGKRGFVELRRATYSAEFQRAARRFETYTHAGEEKRVDTSYWENVDISL